MVFEDALFSHFGIRKGVTAIIGGGGKTTLLIRLGIWYRAFGSVVLTTSTHIFPPEQFSCVESVSETLSVGQCITVGKRCSDGKLSAPEQSISDMARLSDYVFVEADGAKKLPVKVHAPHEPVIPSETVTVIAVLGLDAIGRPIETVVHRYPILCEKENLQPRQELTSSICAGILLSYPNVRGVLLNKAEHKSDFENGRQIAKLLPYPVAITSLCSEYPKLELWRNGTCLLS